MWGYVYYLTLYLRICVRLCQYVHVCPLQDLVDLLQQRLVLLVEESSRDMEVLRQVGSELLCLQSSEVKLEGLVEELHAEAQHRAAVAEGLQAELHAEAERSAAVTESLHTELRRWAYSNCNVSLHEGVSIKALGI